MPTDSGERRLLPALLALSAVAFAGITLDEGFSGKASPPVKGDKPTYGFGSTMRPDGSPVRSGDTITPPAAIQLSLRQAEVKERAIKRCVTAPLFQHEYDAFVSIAYNVGESKFCASQIVAKANAQDYAGACAEILRWRFFHGHDCSLVANKKLCGGIWSRRQNEAARCRGELK